MSFPSYPTYKESGLAWFSNVPRHWRIEAIKRLCLTASGGTPDTADFERYYTTEGGVPWIRTMDLNNGRLSQWEYALTDEGLGASASRVVQPGAVLVAMYGGDGTIGKNALLEMEACTNQAICALVPSLGLLGRYLFWFVQFYRPYWMVGAESSRKDPNISQDLIQNTLMVLPPLQEQHAIADFLDRETAKIDALVEEQKRLIELLKEKRQAVISHAVTKGLDPNAPMKNSDVEWLGQVPQHWNMRRLKHISPTLTVGIVVNPSEYVSDEGLPFIYGGDISEGRIDISGARRIKPHDSERQSKTKLKAGDLVTVRVGAPGVTAVVPPECEGGNCASVMLIKRGNFDPHWLCYAFNSRIVRYQVELVQYGAAQEQFNISHAVNFWVPTPTPEEQKSISRMLDEVVGQFDRLVNEAESAISLLLERRSALISAAVTGKIDVRGVAAAAAAEAA